MSLPQMPTDLREMRTSRGPSFSSSATSRRARRSFSSRTSAFMICSSSSASHDNPTDDERQRGRDIERQLRLQESHPEQVNGDEHDRADEDAVEQVGPDRQEAAAVPALLLRSNIRHHAALTGAGAGGATAAGAASRIMSATALSAMARAGALVLPLITVGMSEQSKTRRPSTPRTRRSGVSTAMESSSRPILQVPTG